MSWMNYYEYSKLQVKDRNEFTCKHVIDAYFKILLAALRQKNNSQILENLFEHRGYYGSYYFSNASILHGK